ncbi:hypothetical protein ACFY97_13245 [Streptomyces klenkii]|uniref:hypothetical protein n=1 Tax=Streptomyces klenkii TaxID=1420899 RepID=UPI0036E67396
MGARLTAAGDSSGRRATVRSCPDCQGEGGRVEETSRNGVVRRTWHACKTCRGSGAR